MMIEEEIITESSQIRIINIAGESNSELDVKKLTRGWKIEKTG